MTLKRYDPTISYAPWPGASDTTTMEERPDGGWVRFEDVQSQSVDERLLAAASELVALRRIGRDSEWMWKKLTEAIAAAHAEKGQAVMIELRLNQEQASAVITLLGQLSAEDKDRLCVGPEHRRVIEELWGSIRGRLQWPCDEFGKHK